MRRHPARRTRTGVAVAAAISTVGLTTVYALGGGASATTSSNSTNGSTSSERSSGGSSTYNDTYRYGYSGDDGYSYDDNANSNSTTITPSYRQPDTSSSAS